MTAPGAQTTVRTSMQIEILVHNSAARNALYAKVDSSVVALLCMDLHTTAAVSDTWGMQPSGILYLWKDSVLVAGLVGEV
jgi:hypothetical protein